MEQNIFLEIYQTDEAIRILYTMIERIGLREEGNGCRAKKYW
jgi:hypothetical protein